MWIGRRAGLASAGRPPRPRSSSAHAAQQRVLLAMNGYCPRVPSGDRLACYRASASLWLHGQQPQRWDTPGTSPPPRTSRSSTAARAGTLPATVCDGARRHRRRPHRRGFGPRPTGTSSPVHTGRRQRRPRAQQGFRRSERRWSQPAGCDRLTSECLAVRSDAPARAPRWSSRSAASTPSLVARARSGQE